ncbi:hypothetical protein L7F22_012329 [Adiantum nelumboides]|nr:hypothetical protein [Adiantum nelumboides]
MMHKLRLEVSGPSGFKGNNVSVKYVGVVTVCGIQVGVNITLLLKPPRKEGKSIQAIVYNVKEGRKESSELETSEDEWSTEDSSSTAEVTSSVSDSESEKASLLEAMGVVLTRPTTQVGESIKETLSDEKIEDMLSTDLSKEERKEVEVMLQKHSPLFILDYKQIKGVTVVEHQIKLKQESQPIAHRLRRLKDRKLQFHRSLMHHSQAASGVTTQEQARPSSLNECGDPHLDLLRRVTNQLDNLSINLIHGLQPQLPVQPQAGGEELKGRAPRRPPMREYHGHNYAEDEHGMYFCPYPNRCGNAPPRWPRQQVSPLRMKPPPMPMCEQQQQQEQVQILRQSTYAIVPKPTAEVPPLPHDGVEQAMNVISYEDKEVSVPSRFKGNDVSVKYVEVVTVCGIQVGVNMYVLPTTGEGYPIILGRPWLTVMNARQDWESRTLLLKPPRKEGKSIQTIVYNVKEGRKESSELETLEDEWSTEDSSSMAEVTSSVSYSESEKASLLEARGVVLTRPTTVVDGSIKETLSDEKIEDMLSTYLSKEERKEFEVMLQKHSPLFILDYKQIKRVTVMEHQIKLKPESQPIAHRLHRWTWRSFDGTLCSPQLLLFILHSFAQVCCHLVFSTASTDYGSLNLGRNSGGSSFDVCASLFQISRVDRIAGCE